MACHVRDEDVTRRWFTPAMLLEQLPHLKTVIDLTNTNRYYNSEEEFRTKGIDHVKILVDGKGKIPPKWQIQRFFDAMDTHMNKYADITDSLIGVHCTHGLNRTGYFICRWMVERLRMNPDEAIQRFNQARGHNIEREPLLNHIRSEYLLSFPPTRQPPPQFRSNRYYSPLDSAEYDEVPNGSRFSRPRDHRGYNDTKYGNNNRAHRRRGGRNDGNKSDDNTNWSLRDDDQNQVRHFKNFHRQNRK
ncbi:unnamed protein product [Ceutorhynchus assimilis]|uniref:Tyrosine specific protein phosphatases domain-containing protein n=1 Tax=Ceutorhynchus assimilis TaxID=467358 RepID=A0A9N9ML07_9CUCU|nr:unnamed protein product [Ceutorhynchus assimilis]